MTPEPTPEPLRTSLQGGLLIAVPRLNDPNFHRMVVLMISHDEEGAFGVVLGPAASVSMADLCKSLHTEWTRPDTPPIRYGGPCEPSRIWLLHGGPAPLPGTSTVAPGVHFGSSVALIRQLGERPELPVAVIAGYAGWGAGQLEHEMQQHSWIPGEITAELVFTTPPEEVWEAALQQMHLTPGMIVSGDGASA